MAPHASWDGSLSRTVAKAKAKAKATYYDIGMGSEGLQRLYKSAVELHRTKVR